MKMRFRAGFVASVSLVVMAAPRMGGKQTPPSPSPSDRDIIVTGSRSQYSNTSTSDAAGAPANSTNALNVINLRNTGLSRTLIL